MGRESDALLLYRPHMTFAEALMWFVFDVIIFGMKNVVIIALTVLVIQNLSRVLEGKSFFDVIFGGDFADHIEWTIECWLLIELVFYVYIRCKARRMAQVSGALKDLRHFPITTRDQRKALLERVLRTVDSVESLVEQWFVDTNVRFDDLSRADVGEIMSYCMFHKKRCFMSTSEVEELEEMSCKLEQHMGRKMTQKPHTEAEDESFERLIARSAMFFTETSITFEHRPLIMYLAIHVLLQKTFVPLRMWCWGNYQKRQVGDMTFWYRRSRTFPGKQCVCFIHGIGVGLLPYCLFFNRLERLADDQGFDIIAIEIPGISQSLFPKPLLPDPFVEDMGLALHSCGFSSAKFISHSYGSFCVNWIITRTPELVEGVMLVDPAAILLHHTDVLYNMLYRTCNNTSLDRVVHYMMRSEIHFVYHIKREFFWFHNAMFFESFPETCKVALVISEADQIIPVKRIAKYAEESRIRYVMLKGCDHGGFLIDEKHLRPVMESIEEWLKKFGA